MSLDPQSIVKRYIDELYNLANVGLVREICADLITRHDPDSNTRLNHQQQIERIRAVVEYNFPPFQKCGFVRRRLELDLHGRAMGLMAHP